MDRASLVHLFDHIFRDADIPSPEKLVKGTAKDAEILLENAPYSILTNLAHTVYWQDLWLKRLRGEPIPPMMEVWKNDWKTPKASEWPKLQKRFVDGLREAREIAASEPFAHTLPTDEQAIDRLCMIAVHGTYHMGQINLLKRMVRASKRS